MERSRFWVFPARARHALGAAATRTNAGSMYTPRRASTPSAGATEVRCSARPCGGWCPPRGEPRPWWGESSRWARKPPWTSVEVLGMGQGFGRTHLPKILSFLKGLSPVSGRWLFTSKLPGRLTLGKKGGVNLGSEAPAPTLRTPEDGLGSEGPLPPGPREPSVGPPGPGKGPDGLPGRAGGPPRGKGIPCRTPSAAWTDAPPGRRGP